MEWLKHLIPGNAPDGSPILSILGKQTYRFANEKTAWIDEAEQIPFIEADEYWGQGNPQTDSMKLESDFVAFKPATDFIILGKAHVPFQKKTGALDIGIQVGEFRKIVRVFGNRKAFITPSGLAFSEPELFSEMPLDYSLAYGGKDEKSDESNAYVYLKNPVGKGFIVKNTLKAIQDLALPNLENPAQLLTPQNLVLGKFENWKNAPEPWALGCQNKSFHPRFTFSGLTPDQWSQAEAEKQKSMKSKNELGSPGSPNQSGSNPLLNPSFFNGASKGLILPHLAGNELIKLAYLDPTSPQFSFTLPGNRPTAWLDVGEGPEDMSMSLHTIVLYKETNQITLLWRGCARYGGIESMKDFKLLEYGIKEA